MRFATSELVQAEELLHDAWVELDNVEHRSGKVTLTGFLERAWPQASLIPRIGRFRWSMEFRGATSLEVDDVENIALIPIERIYYDPNSEEVLVVGSIPGRIVIRGPRPECLLFIADEPTHIRRFGKWEPAGQASTRK